MHIVDEQAIALDMKYWAIAAGRDIVFVLGLATVKCFFRSCEILNESVDIVLVQTATQNFDSFWGYKRQL